jgi:hypothetical protein
MPGFSQICGFMPLSSVRRPDPDKPRTVLVDVEIVVDPSNEENVGIVKGLLSYYIPFDAGPPSDGVYFVSLTLLVKTS